MTAIDKKRSYTANDIIEIINKGEFISAFTNKIIRDIEAVTNHFFKDDWEFRMDDSLSNTGKFINLIVILHYDKIKVTNKKAQFVYIHDVYMKICLEGKIDNSIEIAYIKMARGSYTAAQHLSGYMWSHAHRINNAAPLNFVSLCYGSDVFQMFMVEFKTKPLTRKQWAMFLLYLQSYLEYESINGGPYIEMSEINDKDYSVKGLIAQEDIRKVLDIVNHIPKENIEYFYENEGFTINTNMIEQWLINRLPNRYKVFYNPSNNTQFVFRNIDIYEPSTYETNIWFKNRNIKLKIIEDKSITEKTYTYEKSINPSIMDAVKEYFLKLLIVANKEIYHEKIKMDSSF